jgi:CheY-like chemotaxis protein
MSAMKRFFADEERMEFEKDDQELINNLISDTRRISSDMLRGHKDGLEIFNVYFDLQGGTILSEYFSTEKEFNFNIPVNDRNMSIFREEDGKTKKSYSWEDKTILIAEDEETNFLYLKAALSRTGAKILRAKTGKEAVDIVKTTDKVDLILMDIKMPEMNGVDATIEIKSLNQKMKIIAQTAYAMEDDRKLYSQIGCVDYLAKPIHRDLLLSTISRYI